MSESLLNDEKIKFEKTSNEYLQQYALISFCSPEENIKKRLIIDVTSFFISELHQQLRLLIDAHISEVNILINNKFEHCYNEHMFGIDEDKDFYRKICNELLLNNEIYTEKYLSSCAFDPKLLTQLIEKIDFTPLEKQKHIYGIKVSGIFSNHEDTEKFQAEINNYHGNKMHSHVISIGNYALYDPKTDLFDNQKFKSDEIIIDKETGQTIDMNQLVESNNINNDMVKSYQQKLYNDTNNLVDIIDIVQSKAKVVQNEEMRKNIEALKASRLAMKNKRIR